GCARASSHVEPILAPMRHAQKQPPGFLLTAFVILAVAAGHVGAQDTAKENRAVTIESHILAINLGRRSSQVAERFSLELDLNLIGLHLQRAGQEGFNALFNRRTYFANNATAQVSHQAFQSSFDWSAKQLPEQGGIGQHHELSALSIPNRSVAQSA